MALAMARSLILLLAAGLLAISPNAKAAASAPEPIKVGMFSVDASPPVGSPLAYDPTKEITLPLSCRGIVLMGEDAPIVLCALDWIGIGNDGQTEFRAAMAEAVGTEPGRVAVHTLHQHDAPRCDFSTARLLEEHGIDPGEVFDVEFARDVIGRAAEAAKQAKAKAKVVTHLGIGEAEVEKVASNRRILGPDGKVEFVRYTACPDPEIRAKPVGTIDPMLKLITFWADEDPLLALSYYATHPQSYYRTGGANPDFPGMARDQRQAETGTFHVHFNGAGGNIGAGKWNDGSPENRQILADRVAKGMADAWNATQRQPITSADLGWESVDVLLPVAPHLDQTRLLERLQDDSASVADRAAAAKGLVWLQRQEDGDAIDITSLKLGPARILHLPGELFVEYQLAAQELRPDLFVAMAAYGDYAPGYIGTEIAYEEGGYETSERATKVAPSVEGVLMEAIGRLLLEAE